MDSNALKDFIFNMWRGQIWDDRTFVARGVEIESKNMKPPTILKNGPNLDVADDNSSAMLMGSINSSNQRISNQSKPESRFEPYIFCFKSLFFFINRIKTSITAQNTIVENELGTSNKTDALHLPAILGVDSKDQSDEQSLSVKSEKNESYGNVSNHDLKEIKKIYSKKVLELGLREEDCSFQVFEEMKSISDEIVDKHDENIEEFKNVGNSLVQYSDEIGSDRIEDSENTAFKNDLNNSLREERESLDETKAMEVGSNDEGNEQFLCVQHSKNNEIIFPTNFTEFQICDPEELQNGNKIFAEFRLRNENYTSNKNMLEIDCKNEVNEQDMPVEQSRNNKKSPKNNFQDDNAYNRAETVITNTKELLKHGVPNENEVSCVLDMNVKLVEEQIEKQKLLLEHSKIIEGNFNQNYMGIENSKGCGGEQNVCDDQQSAKNTKAGKGMKRTASENDLQRKRLKKVSNDEQGNQERSGKPKQIINNSHCTPLILRRPLRNHSLPKMNNG